MALDFSNYSTLLTSIAGVLHRADLNNDIPGFVDLCEADMAARLDDGNDEASTTLSLTTSGSVTLPTGFKRMRRMRCYDGTIYWDLPQNALAPSEYNGVTPSRPVSYTISGSTITSRPLPDKTYTLALDYYGTFTPLTGTATNWILTSYPAVYLYGSLLHSAPFLGQDVRIPVWNSAYEDAMEKLVRADFKKRMSQLKTRSDVAPMSYPGRYDISTDYPS